MHLAAELAKIDIVEMLLKAGLDLTIQDRVRNFLHQYNYAHTATQYNKRRQIVTLI